LRQRLVRALGGVAVVALIASGAVACSKPASTASKDCGLKIGFFGALSGENAGLVVPGRNGAALALGQYNAAHADCTVEIQDYDSQGSPDKAPALAQGAVSDTKVIGILGPAFSGESEVADPIFETAGLPTITQSATRPTLGGKWKIFHRGVGNDFAQGPAAGNYIKNTLKPEKVFLVKDDSAYGLGLSDEVVKILGTTIVGQDQVQTDQKIFNTTVTKVVGSGATVLFYGGYTKEASPFLKQLRAKGWKGTLVGGDGLYDANMLSATGQADVEGTVVTCPCGPATAAKGTFVADFKAKFNQDPAVYADVTFDIMNIFLEGLGAGNTTRAKMQAFLTSYNKAGSATGVTYKWGADGELDKSQVVVWAFKAEGGAWKEQAAIPLT